MSFAEYFDYSVHNLTLLGMVMRFLAATLAGAVVGYTRGKTQHAAGLRTHILVCIGAAGTVIMSEFFIWSRGISGDAARIPAQVVSGIGFLGAGTIIVTAHNRIKGLTTAAGLWASACVGLAVGIGLYEVALVSGASIFLVLTLLHRSELGLRRRSNVVEFYVELDPHVPLGSFLRSAKSCGLELNGILKEYDSGYGEDSLAFMVTIRGKKNLHRDEIIQTVRQFEGIRHLEPL